MSRLPQTGNIVMVPRKHGRQRGKARIGWIEIDPTGYAAFVTEDGAYAATAIG